MIIEQGRNKEGIRSFSLRTGSLITDREFGDLFLVLDVGKTSHNGPPIQSFEIIDEEQSLLSFSASLYPQRVKEVLDRVWPERRIVEAFEKSYGIDNGRMSGIMAAVENRGPRTFEVNFQKGL